MYRGFSRDVTAAMLEGKNNETAAMLEGQKQWNGGHVGG